MAGSTLRGSCLCGDVAFEIEGDVAPLAHCHCSMCRKTHGTAFASFVSAPNPAFRWLRGSEKVRHFATSSGGARSFCPRCGSAVPGEPSGFGVFVPAGLLEDDPKVRLLPHIFAASKAPWHEIHDDAPRFDEFPPGVGKAQPTKRATEPKQDKVRGACLCGAAAYEIDAPIEGVIVCCHCSRCRKARAAAHATNLFVPLARFRWLRGEDQVDAYKVPEAQRFTQSFCRVCSSPMPRVNPVMAMVVVPAGGLEDDPGVREGRHIFVTSKAPWYEIRDALPQYAEYPPA